MVLGMSLGSTTCNVTSTPALSQLSVLNHTDVDAVPRYKLATRAISLMEDN